MLLNNDFDRQFRSLIESLLRAYFAELFGIPPEHLDPKADLKSEFHLDPIQWRELGGNLNRLRWMRELGAHITPAQMEDTRTLADLADTIWKNISTYISNNYSSIIDFYRVYISEHKEYKIIFENIITKDISTVKEINVRGNINVGGDITIKNIKLGGGGGGRRYYNWRY
jgi:hypothetical protein